MPANLPAMLRSILKARQTASLIELRFLRQAILTLRTETANGQIHVLAAIAEFERELIRERVVAGLRRAQARGKRLGRLRTHHITPAAAHAALEEHGGRLRATARALRLHPETLRRALAVLDAPRLTQ